MKNKYAFIFLTVLCAVFACEQIDESALAGGETVEKVQMSFTGVIENDADTKTVLAEGDNAGVKKVLWQPGDEIAVSPEVENRSDSWAQVSRFTSTLSSSAATSEFDGSAAFAARYKAFYPYSETVRDSSNVFLFELPATQKYVDGSFDPQAAPMVAYAERGNDFEFRNVCGIVAFKLTGSEAVKSITFSGTDATGSHVMLAGTFEVNPASEDLVMKLHAYSTGRATLTLDCIEPVQLNEAAPTTFYMMLPPATYAEFSLIITTSDGDVMLKSGRNLTIARSHIKPTGALQYVESVYVDLSAKGTANSYIVPAAGLYSFKADVVGNGIDGYLDGEAFCPSVPDISPNSVELLWEEKEGLVNALTLKDGKIHFITNGVEGNALVAAKDANNNVLWSWHLWMTDNPVVHTYLNDKGTFYVLDRNIGAVRADRGVGDEWMESMGLLYQWGRKDPFSRSVNPSLLKNPLYMSEVPAMPTTLIIENDKWLKSDEWSGNLWNVGMKTIYDPCPVGYRVIEKDAWYGFTDDGKNADRSYMINASGAFDYGWNFYYDGVNTAWYPSSYYYSWAGYLIDRTDKGAVWSAKYKDWYPEGLEYYYSSDMECHVKNIETSSELSTYYTHPVRCMIDDVGDVPEIEMYEETDITSSSVTLNADIILVGSTNVHDKGFIWGTKPDLSDGQYVNCGEGYGAYSYTLSDLSVNAVYYAKAYARNSLATVYSNVHRITTLYSDDIENLSADGTANCYMVKPITGTYSFDARVQGNSYDVISPVSADVTWEIDIDHNRCDNIIDNVRLTDGWVLFDLPANTQPGNAQIAVRDANDNILWSWHIWVVDYDPDKDYHIYESGAVVMDRDLGALFAEPDYNDLKSTDCRTWGAYYQWGRKDPLFSSIQENWRNYYFDTIDEAIRNPNTPACGSVEEGNYTKEYWLYPFDFLSWTSDEQTKYDPCPYGWKVQTDKSLRTMSGESNTYGVKYNIEDGETAWYSAYGDGETPVRWLSNYLDGTHVYNVYMFSYKANWQYTFPSATYPVRCMKDE